MADRGLAESTVRTAYTVLRAVLDTAVRDEALARNPAAAVARPKVTSREAAFLSPAQVRVLMSEAASSVPLKVVSEILGHFSVSITGDIYAHVSPDVSAQAMDALGAALHG